MSAFADGTVNIDGVYYQLNNGWSIGYYDSNNVWKSTPYYNKAAFVVSEPGVEIWQSGCLETYQGDLVIPEKVSYNGEDYTVVSISYGAFANCELLTSIQLPSTVVYIDSYAFMNCKSLSILNLPKSTIKVENETFNNSYFSQINVDSNNEMYSSIDGVLYDKNITQILSFPAKKTGKYTVPSTISTIKANSFPSDLSLDELVIPSNVTTIESNSFRYNQIKKLTIEDSEEELTIGSGNGNMTGFSDENGTYRESRPMFQVTESIYWGRSLKYSSRYSSPMYGSFSKVTFGKNVTSVPKYTFANCWNVNTVDNKGGINQWCNFDFSGLYTSPFSSTMKGMASGEPVYTVLFDGEELSGDVTISNDITKIPAHAFQYGCTKVTALTLPAGITEIEDGAFKGLTSLKTINLTQGDSYYKVIDNVLYNNDITKILCFPQMIEGDYTMPSTISEIGDYQFYNCQNLTGVTLSDKLKSISKLAFANCAKIQSITIPASVETIDQGAFYNCAALANVVMDSQSKLTTINDSAFAYCSKLTTISIPASVDTIKYKAFYGCASLANVIWNDQSKLKEILSYAFADCSQLSSIAFPPSVTRIYDDVFDGCSSLKDVTFEDGEDPLLLGKGKRKRVESWGTTYDEVGLFGCCPVEKVYIGRNLSFSDTNFKGYYESWDLTHKKYNYAIFSNNYDGNSSNKLKSVTIGNKVTAMPGGLFYNCYGIKEVNYDGNIIDWCNISFADNCATPFNNSSAILYLQGSPLHSKVDIPEGATKIGSYSFYGQRGVSTFIVPSTVTTIEPYAFNSSYVSEVRINATNIINLTDTTSFNSNTNIYIGDDVVANYKAANPWSDISNRIFPMGFLDVTVNLIAMQNSPALLPALNALEQVNGEYRITALTNLKIKGTMNGWDILMIRNKMPNLRTLDLTEATILDNDGGYEYYQGHHTTANTISAYSFYQLSNLRKVMLPQNITSIDERAFEECRNLSEVLYIPETCTNIGYRAFANSGLSSIEINKGVKTIENEAFYQCNNLTSVTLVKGLEQIYGGAFQSCGNLRSLVLPTTLKRIEGYAFYSCYSLTDIDFAEGLEYIGSEAFSYCSSLKDLHMPTSLKNVEYGAFRYCSGLSEVHVPSMMKEVGDYAFTGCGLKSVYAYTVNPIQINQNTFDYKGVDLYAPENSFYAYYLNTQWSQFADVKEFEALYTNWYTARNTDIEIDLKKPIKNKDDKNPADGIMEPGSGLIFIGNGEQLVKKLIMNWNHGTEYPSLIEDHNLSVEELKFIMNVSQGRWYFFSFPFDVKLKDIKHDGKWVFRYYDGVARAENGSGGWKNVVGDVLKAGVGYIFQCNKDGDLELPIEKPDFSTNTVGTGNSDKNIELASHEATNPQDASWNFIGNPNLSYYSLEDMKEDFTSPVTVWDAEMQTYTAVVPGDDDYDFHPFQAFFVQKPSNSDKMEFKAENRVTYNQAQKHNASRAMTRGTRGVDENHMIINVEISNGLMSDKTRIVFDNAKSADYEAESDASKFMSLAEVPQIYTLDARDVKYSVNARPDDNKEIRLGVKVPSEGSYTIKAPRMDFNIALKDNETGTIHNFSDGDYTFLADAGVYENRFSICKSSFNTTNISEAGIDGLDITNVDGGISVNGIADKPVTIYNVSGIRKATLTTSGVVTLANGTYIVNMGDKSTKVFVK